MNTHPFAEACVATTVEDRAICSMVSNRHPSFAGVSIQDLVTAADTEGRLSCHLVHVAPGCSLAEHDHPAQTELHQVAGGEGLCRLANKEIAYRPGEMAVISQGERHSVTASDRGLTLVATFCPALK